MNNIKKVIAIYASALVAVMSLGITNVHASEVTGIISSSATSSTSQSGGTLDGNVGAGSTVSGTVGGTSGTGSTVSGTVGGTSGGGGTISGSVSTGGGGGGGSSTVGNQSNSGEGLVLGASTVSDTPGLPSAGVGPVNSTTASWSSIALLLGLLLGAIGYGMLNYR